ncbi:MAG: HDOD domain-containing protein [Bryobacteraceae bacterium]
MATLGTIAPDQNVFPHRAPCHKELILKALDKLPPFSPVLNRVLATLADEDVSFGELAGLIETDTVLAGNLLRIVNSPLYGHRATINSVRHGVAIIGLNRIRNLVLALTVSSKWAKTAVPRRWSHRHFNLHSLAVAVLSDLLILEFPAPYPEGAFVAGLLHDIGKLLIAMAVPDEFEKICALCESGESTMEAAEQHLLGISHAEVSGLVLEKWNLPLPIRQAVTSHHSPMTADCGRLHLAHVVQIADHYVNAHNLGMPPYWLKPDAGVSFAEFGLGDIIQKVAESFQTEFAAIRGTI